MEALRKELIEKQELLSQAAKAFELHEEQKDVTSRNQAEYERSLENERRRIAELEQGKLLSIFVTYSLKLASNDFLLSFKLLIIH